MRDFLQFQFLPFTAQLRSVFVLLGDLNTDQRLDELVLLFGGGTRLFGFDALDVLDDFSREFALTPSAAAIRCTVSA